uniref:Putative rep protein n=1 Tax=uncultured virus TaxID=340016 RepID=A0A1D8MJX3_9VIRU|nr:putative rep protein [uncultured virus]
MKVSVIESPATDCAVHNVGHLDELLLGEDAEATRVLPARLTHDAPALEGPSRELAPAALTIGTLCKANSALVFHLAYYLEGELKSGRVLHLLKSLLPVGYVVACSRDPATKSLDKEESRIRPPANWGGVCAYRHTRPRGVAVVVPRVQQHTPLVQVPVHVLDGPLLPVELVEKDTLLSLVVPPRIPASDDGIAVWKAVHYPVRLASSSRSPEDKYLHLPCGRRLWRDLCVQCVNTGVIANVISWVLLCNCSSAIFLRAMPCLHLSEIASRSERRPCLPSLAS